MLKMSWSRLTNHGFESFKGNVYVDTVHFLSHKHTKVGVDIGLQLMLHVQLLSSSDTPLSQCNCSVLYITRVEVNFAIGAVTFRPCPN